MPTTSLVVVLRDDNDNILGFLDEGGNKLSLSNMIADAGNPKGLVVPGTPQLFRVNEGMSLTMSVASGGVGKYEEIDIKTQATLKTVNLASNQKTTTTAQKGIHYYLVTCTAGSINVSVEDAVLGLSAVSLRTTKPKTVAGSTSMVLPTAAGGSANQTWHLTTVAARSFNAVEVIYANVGATYTTYDHVAVAASSSLATAASHSTPDQSWNVGAGNLVMGATGTPTLPLLASSGVIPCRSVPRTDGGKYPLVHIRTHTVSNLPAYGNMANAGWDANNPDWVMEGYSQGAGDFCSTNQAAFTSTTRNNILVPAIVKFHYDVVGYTGLGIGDSIMGGDSVLDGAPARMSYGYRAIRKLQDAGLPFDFVNSAVSGNTWAQYAPRGKAAIDLLKPDFVLIPVFTPNDPSGTQAQIDTQWRNAMDLAEYAVAANVVPILVTPFPQNGTTVATDNLRLQNRTRAMNSGFNYLDVEPLVSDRASPARYISGLNNDVTHPNAIANDIVGDALKNLLMRIYY